VLASGFSSGRSAKAFGGKMETSSPPRPILEIQGQYKGFELIVKKLPNVGKRASPFMTLEEGALIILAWGAEPPFYFLGYFASCKGHPLASCSATQFLRCIALIWVVDWLRISVTACMLGAKSGTFLRIFSLDRAQRTETKINVGQMDVAQLSPHRNRQNMVRLNCEQTMYASTAGMGLGLLCWRQHTAGRRMQIMYASTYVVSYLGCLL
jgi:hypothetical protein